MRLLMASAIVLLAGCATPASPAGEGTQDLEPERLASEGTAPGLATFAFNGTLTSVAGYVGFEPDMLASFEASVLDGATAVVVELAWNDTVQDLDAYLIAPNGCFERVPFPQSPAVCLADFFVAEGEYGAWWDRDGALGIPDSPGRIVVNGDQLAAGGTGTWTVDVWSKDVVRDLAYHAFVTVVYDGRDADALTAIPWAGA